MIVIPIRMSIHIAVSKIQQICRDNIAGSIAYTQPGWSNQYFLSLKHSRHSLIRSLQLAQFHPWSVITFKHFLFLNALKSYCISFSVFIKSSLFRLTVDYKHFSDHRFQAYHPYFMQLKRGNATGQSRIEPDQCTLGFFSSMLGIHHKIRAL